MADRVFARPPSSQALSDEVVELLKRLHADVPEVVPGAVDVLVQLVDHGFQAVLRPPSSRPHLVPNPCECFSRDVESRLPWSPSELMAEEIEVLFSRIEHPSLLWVQL